jgi:hypothetical protein
MNSGTSLSRHRLSQMVSDCKNMIESIINTILLIILIQEGSK